MRVKTVEEARALEGRTFEKDGNRRYVRSVTGLTQLDGAVVGGHVHWMRPDKPGTRVVSFLPYFNQWLDGATEVLDDKQRSDSGD